MYPEEAFVPLSALRHFLVCPRQCALIHLDQIWTENVYTAEGRVLHERADSGKDVVRGDLKTVTGLPLCSRELGLAGKADVVEFHREGDVWRPFPVEYKRGRPKKHDADKVQLCAQAICLEEMLQQSVVEGALYYGATRRRLAVNLDAALRELTIQTAEAVHRLFASDALPPPRRTAICKSCSLVESCLPDLNRTKAGTFLESLREEEP